MNNINNWCNNLTELQRVLPPAEPLLVTGLNAVGGFAVDVASAVGRMGVTHAVKEVCKGAATAIIGENPLTPAVNFVAGKVGGVIADGAIAIATPITRTVTAVSKDIINGIATGVNDEIDKVKSLFITQEKPENSYIGRIQKIQVEKSKTTKRTIVLNIIVAIIAIAAVACLVAFPPIGAGVIAAAVVIGAIAIGIIAFTSYRAHKTSKKCSTLVKVYDAYISHLKNPNEFTWQKVSGQMENLKPFQTKKVSKT